MTHPLSFLQDYERRGKAHVVDLSTEEDRRVYWRSIVFRIDSTFFLLDEHEAAELLTMPDLASIPGTKRWVSGIANVRGELLPVIDFKDFLYGEPAVITKQSRVLVVRSDEVQSGLLVDQVVGARKFPEDTLRPALTTDFPDELRKIVSGRYEEEETFHIISVQKLVEETGFMQAAA